jgi:hypothetical protein
MLKKIFHKGLWRGCQWCACAIWAGWFMMRPVAMIHIQEMGGLMASSDLQRVLSRHTMPWFLLSLKHLKQDFETLGYFEQVVIRRTWPYIISISLKDCSPLFRMVDHQWLSTQGKVYRVTHPNVTRHDVPVLHLAGYMMHDEWMMHHLVRNHHALQFVLKKNDCTLRAMRFQSVIGWRAVVQCRDRHIAMQCGMAWPVCLKRLQHWLHAPIGRCFDASQVMVDMRYAHGFSVTCP